MYTDLFNENDEYFEIYNKNVRKSKEKLWIRLKWLIQSFVLHALITNSEDGQNSNKNVVNENYNNIFSYIEEKDDLKVNHLSSPRFHRKQLWKYCRFWSPSRY